MVEWEGEGLKEQMSLVVSEEVRANGDYNNTIGTLVNYTSPQVSIVSFILTDIDCFYTSVSTDLYLGQLLLQSIAALVYC